MDPIRVATSPIFEWFYRKFQCYYIAMKFNLLFYVVLLCACPGSATKENPDDSGIVGDMTIDQMINDHQRIDQMPESDTSIDTMPTPDFGNDPCAGVNLSQFYTPNCDAAGGLTSSEIPPNNLFSTSWFGCYYDTNGTLVKDPYDNCEFACGHRGYCDGPSDGSPECEAELKWFAADSDRFGCGGHILVKNCLNQRSVVLVALDRGPRCSTIEQSAQAPILDMSHDAMLYLFDTTHGGTDLAGVVVTQVDTTVPLGPVE